MMDAAAAPDMTRKPASRPAKPGFNRGAFYRLCRALHGYLSAFAFLALIFFAGTGLMLNHPEWFGQEEAASDASRTTLHRTLPRASLERSFAASDPAAAFASLVAESEPTLRGAYTSGEILDGEVMLRFEGVTGASDVVIDLSTSRADISIRPATTVSMLYDLHRGKNAGTVWKRLIDVVASVVLALSLIGYVLFFSLRFRLPSSLALTGLSALVVFGIFIVFVP